MRAWLQLVALGAIMSFAPLRVDAAEQSSLAPMLERVLPSIVTLVVELEATDEFGDAPTMIPSKKAFVQTQESEELTRRTGSGVVIDGTQGLILTNGHLIDNAAKISVGTFDGASYEASIVGVDLQTDLAVLRIGASNLASATLGDSSRLRVGDYVVAVGNPFGLTQTVTLGIVSALNRSHVGAEEFRDFIQTDAALNPGNSGGALLNLDGELVGINTAIMAPSGANAGIGFAIPINLARRVAAQLISDGKIDRGQIGVIVQDLTTDLAEALMLGTTTGALVTEVLQGSSAERAGLQVGDAISVIDGVAIRTAAELRSTIIDLAPGSKVIAKGFRGHRRLEAPIEVGRQTSGEPEELPLVRMTDGFLKGVLLQDVALKPRGAALGIQVLEVEQNTPAARAGLMAGDLIVGVNQIAVGSLNDIAPPQATDDLLLLTVYRDAHALFIAVRSGPI